MLTKGQLSLFELFKIFFWFFFRDNLQMNLRFMGFFRDEFNVKFSDNDACSSAKVVDPNAFQNMHTKDVKVMMNF